ncbi:putative dolichol-phosphate mannosyltransferase [Rosellinia necatrix]|uniref:Putative dolichol-phosphate mannosyltransferase n=1 Tax=Rosellinia necatrix TaxID=77044 RepID=A0A1W2TLR1_ROSNE|nr:putative dolichol-phosphate mannosyltransferase [Rosellinia necatrix]
MPPANTFTTTVHPFPSPTTHACAYEIGPDNANNALVFIGGLGDGPHTVPYPRALAKRLQEDPDLGYSVFEFRLKSSFSAFGFARLADDVADIVALVRYLRSIGKERVVLMGHSTGCQDCIEYAAPSHDAPPVEGYILQAPVCDRDAMALEMGDSKLEESIAAAEQLINAGKGQERMPLAQLPSFMHDTPISASRWYALAAVNGEDNYFSPDLTDEVATPYWLRIDKPLLILHSGDDEFVPKSVNMQSLVNHWRRLCRPGIASNLSGTIPGAGHRVEEPKAEEWLVNTVIKFLRSIQ